MPFINSKVTMKLDDAKKEELKAAFGRAAGDALGKSESWVMVDIEDEQDIWFAGEKKDSAAYVGVELVGNPARDASAEFSKQVCELCGSVLGIPKDSVYVVLKPVEGYHWGWNGQTF